MNYASERELDYSRFFFFFALSMSRFIIFPIFHSRVARRFIRFTVINCATNGRLDYYAFYTLQDLFYSILFRYALFANLVDSI